MMKNSELVIPHGIGFSKRVFVAMAVVLSIIAILFVYFINHYSAHKHIAANQKQKVVMNDQSDVLNTINKIEAHKFDRNKNDANKSSNTATALHPKSDSQTPETAQSTTQNPALNNDSFKTAGESQLSVYHNANSMSSNSINSVGGAPATSEPITSGAPPSQPDPYAIQNGQSQKIAFLQSSTNNSDSIHSTLKVPFSKYQIMTGTIIPATLVTGIDSDLPGTITAKVSRDIYDSATGNYLLIPQGTTIIGAYDSQVSVGQSRVLIAWQRLIFPNGNSFDLNSMPGTDLMGMAGISDLVNHHYMRIFGSSLMMSMFGAAGQLSQPKNTSENQMSDSQIIYAAIGQQMSQTSSQLIAKNMDIQPTITIRPGADFNVLLTRDMVLPTYYHF